MTTTKCDRLAAALLKYLSPRQHRPVSVVKVKKDLNALGFFTDSISSGTFHKAARRLSPSWLHVRCSLWPLRFAEDVATAEEGVFPWRDVAHAKRALRRLSR